MKKNLHPRIDESNQDNTYTKQNKKYNNTIYKEGIKFKYNK